MVFKPLMSYRINILTHMYVNNQKKALWLLKLWKVVDIESSKNYSSKQNEKYTRGLRLNRDIL